MRLGRGTWVLCACACAVPTTTAYAGEIYAYNEDMEIDSFESFFMASYRADPGEANRVVATFDAATSTYTLFDSAASRMVPSDGHNNAAADICTFEPQRVVCRATPGFDLSPKIHTYDGDDQVTMNLTGAPGDTFPDVYGGAGDDAITLVLPAATSTTQRIGGASGGEGDDTLTGGLGVDYLDGDAGADRIVGGKAEDWLDGGAGDDRIDARDLEADIIECGDGSDRLKADPTDFTSNLWPIYDDGCESIGMGL